MLCQVPCSHPSDYTELYAVPLEYRKRTYDIHYKDGYLFIAHYDASGHFELLKVENETFERIKDGYYYTTTYKEENYS